VSTGIDINIRIQIFADIQRNTRTKKHTNRQRDTQTELVYGIPGHSVVWTCKIYQRL